MAIGGSCTVLSRHAFETRAITFRYQDDANLNVYMLNNPDEADSASRAIEILDIIVRVVNKAAAIEKEPIDIGHGVLLYASEVHCIDVAGRYPDENVSQIAVRLGVTKGAVSQTAKKLEEKGYLARVNREGDKKTVLLQLTDRGWEAFEWHRMYHESVNHKIAGELAGLNRNDIENLKKILIQLESMLDGCPAVRQTITLQFRKTMHTRSQ